jgi:sugar phosphate isomerase/epimerase
VRRRQHTRRIAGVDVNKPPLPDLGLGCWTVGDITFAALVDTAERHGFRRLTVNPYMFARALDAGWSETSLRQRLDTAGISVHMIDALTDVFPGVPSGGNLDASLRATLGPAVVDAPGRGVGLRAAHALGARSVNVTHYLGTPTPHAQLAESLARVCREAAGFGLLVCVEFIPKTSIPDLATAARLVGDCGEQNARILLDTWHHARSGGTVDDVRSLPPGCIGAIQLSDRVPPEDRSGDGSFAGRWLPGDGTLPLVEIVAAALANSGELTIDLEVINTELGAQTTDEIVGRAAAAATRWRRIYERA